MILTDPIFSVIIPTYNRSQLVCNAIQSVLNQTCDNFELIVVDDHSTDNTAEMIHSIQDKRLKYVLNDHRSGGAGTRNAGIFRARGRWVAFLDDDDTWLPQKLRRQLDKLCKLNDDVGLIYSGRTGYNRRNQKLNFMPLKRGWIQKDLLYENYIGTYSTVVIRAGLLKKLGGLDEDFPALQDRELYVRVAEKSRVSYVDEVLVQMGEFYQERISLTAEKKLVANILFREKYKGLICQSRHLKHIWASRIFLYAFLKPNNTANLRLIFNNLPWTVSGIFVDPINLIKTFGKLATLYCLKKRT